MWLKLRWDLCFSWPWIFLARCFLPHIWLYPDLESKHSEFLFQMAMALWQQMIAAEAPVLFAKACEMFILELTLRSWIHTEENKRRTLQRNDIAGAITRGDIFDFLVDIVPRDELKVRVYAALDICSSAITTWLSTFITCYGDWSTRILAVHKLSMLASRMRIWLYPGLEFQANQCHMGICIIHQFKDSLCTTQWQHL